MGREAPYKLYEIHFLTINVIRVGQLPVICTSAPIISSFWPSSSSDRYSSTVVMPSAKLQTSSRIVASLSIILIELSCQSSSSMASLLSPNWIEAKFIGTSILILGSTVYDCGGGLLVPSLKTKVTLLSGSSLYSIATRVPVYELGNAGTIPGCTKLMALLTLYWPDTRNSIFVLIGRSGASTYIGSTMQGLAKIELSQISLLVSETIMSA